MTEELQTSNISPQTLLSKARTKLEAQAERLQATINALRAKGHPCPDAEGQLQAMKQGIDLLK